MNETLLFPELFGSRTSSYSLGATSLAWRAGAGMSWEVSQQNLPMPPAEAGWVPAEVYSRLAQDFVTGWALISASESSWPPILAVYELDGHVFRKFLHRSSPWIRNVASPEQRVHQFYPVSRQRKPRDVLETARYLKHNLQLVADLVAMAEKTSMCRCEMNGKKATRVMSRLCSEVQAWIHKDAADMRSLADPAMPATSVEEVWLKVLEVWGHFAREHLPYMLRPGGSLSQRAIKS